MMVNKIWIGLTLCLSTFTINAQSLNELSTKEQKKGWQLLFDGKTTKGWHNYLGTSVSDKWVVEDGCLKLTGKGGGDIVTDSAFTDFELKLEWKISAKGNSGIFYLVNEKPEIGTTWQSGLECQVLDNFGHPDNKVKSHWAASLYDLIAASPDNLTRPIGEFNEVIIKLKKGKLEHWLNGKRVVKTRLWTDEWKQMVAESKFNKYPNFGASSTGKIALQDHSDVVWYRNIKIRKL